MGASHTNLRIRHPAQKIWTRRACLLTTHNSFQLMTATTMRLVSHQHTSQRDQELSQSPDQRNRRSRLGANQSRRKAKRFLVQPQSRKPFDLRRIMFSTSPYRSNLSK